MYLNAFCGECMEPTVKQLAANDLNEARKTFALMAKVFGEEYEPLSDEYLKTLADRGQFWALAACTGN